MHKATCSLQKLVTGVLLRKFIDRKSWRYTAAQMNARLIPCVDTMRVVGLLN
jgi:hypothetical protein